LRATVELAYYPLCTNGEVVVIKSLSSLLLLALLLLAGAPAPAADRPWAIDEVMGRADAPITIIEYASLTCVHCAKFTVDTLPDLKKNWIDTGKAKLIMRDFPWDPMAQAAAMIAHCSGERYFVFIDTFYHSQENWLRSAQPLESLKKIARLGGMGPEEADKCLQDRVLLNEIMARKEDGEKIYGVDSTPTFIINGKAVSGEKDYDSFAKLLAEQKK
jgi:protein-disulfide isomerase